MIPLLWLLVWAVYGTPDIRGGWLYALIACIIWEAL